MDQLREHIQKLREDFSKGILEELQVDRDPARQFSAWMQQAVEARIIELQAMHLSTVGVDGRPSSRIVYLREFGDNRFTFYTNYNSRKAKELEKNPHASLTFFWPHLERQIRIEGSVSRAPAQQSDAYFVNRPYESQVGAWASQQSARLTSREELDNKVHEIKKKMSPESIKRPEFWGGIILQADYYEFWQGRPSRLHDRICYNLENENWRLSRLAP